MKNKLFLCLVVLSFFIVGCGPKTKTPIEEDGTLNTSSSKRNNTSKTVTSTTTAISKVTTMTSVVTTKSFSKKELEQIAKDNEPYKYSVWNQRPDFNVPKEIEYDIKYQKFYWEWNIIGYISLAGSDETNPQYGWVVGADKSDQNSCPIDNGGLSNIGEQNGHYRAAIKYMPEKPKENGTKIGEKKKEIYLYCYNGTYKIKK